MFLDLLKWHHSIWCCRLASWQCISGVSFFMLVVTMCCFLHFAVYIWGPELWEAIFQHIPEIVYVYSVPGWLLHMEVLVVAVSSWQSGKEINLSFMQHSWTVLRMVPLSLAGCWKSLPYFNSLWEIISVERTGPDFIFMNTLTSP